MSQNQTFAALSQLIFRSARFLHPGLSPAMMTIVTLETNWFATGCQRRSVSNQRVYRGWRNSLQLHAFWTLGGQPAAPQDDFRPSREQDSLVVPDDVLGPPWGHNVYVPGSPAIGGRRDRTRAGASP